MWETFRRVLVQHMGMFRPLTIVELGGADSDVYHRCLLDFDVAAYHAIDQNGAGLSRLKRRALSVTIHHQDILHASTAGLAADLVLSAGLVEHFTPSGTEAAIAHHFALAKPGGLVLLSFPRPTPIYWLTRWLATAIGMFSADLYERPLRRREVEPIIRRHGELLAYETVWSVGLTQSVVLARRHAVS
jgi:hypothetical protein